MGLGINVCPKGHLNSTTRNMCEECGRPLTPPVQAKNSSDVRESMSENNHERNELGQTN